MSGTGRPSIFPNKTARIHGRVSTQGALAFEKARERLARLTGWPLEQISEGDCVEFLARGEKASLPFVRRARRP